MINNRAVRPTLAWASPSAVSLSLHFDVLQMCVKTRRKKKPSGRDMFASTVNQTNGRNGVEGVEIPSPAITVTVADEPQRKRACLDFLRD